MPENRTFPKFVVRDAVVDDCFAVESVRVASWQYAYRGLISDTYLDTLDVGKVSRKRLEQGFPRLAHSPDSFTLVAEGSEGIVGFAMAGPPVSPQDTPVESELVALYVLPEFLGQGAGTALMKEVLWRLGSQGASRVGLWTLEGNAIGRAFYERKGGIVSGHKDLKTAGTLLPALLYIFHLNATPLETPCP